MASKEEIGGNEMLGLQAYCFWVMMSFNTARHTFLYQKLRVDTRSGYVIIQEETW